MMRDDAPMTTLSADEWAQFKRATRHMQFMQRLGRVAETTPAEFLAAVKRDDATDPYASATPQRQAA